MSRLSPGISLDHFVNELRRETDECIIWPYYSIDGYGLVHIGTKDERVHRRALMLRIGKPPEDKPLACHKCRNRLCFNYRHLYWGDYADNARDMVRDGTLRKGRSINTNVLTESQVLAIRDDVRSQRIIAADYGVSHGTINHIKTRRNWSWL